MTYGSSELPFLRNEDVRKREFQTATQLIRNILLKVSRSKTIQLTAGTLMLLSSGFFWFMYIANGIAYGSIVGLPGRAGDLTTFAFRADIYLATAVVIETAGIGLVMSLFIAQLPIIAERMVLRLSFPIVIGVLASLAVFVVIKGR